VAPNLPSSLQHVSALSDYLSNECSAGRMAGPFAYPPCANLRCSGIGAVPKKSGAIRMIDDAVRIIQKHGPGCLLAKVDLKHAFRICPVNKADWPLLGIYWQGCYYIDKVLPFGLRSSPYLFNRLADALNYIATRFAPRRLSSLFWGLSLIHLARSCVSLTLN